MKTTVIHRRHSNGAPEEVYIGRPSKWGNPFAIGVDGDREAVVKKYKKWIRNQLTFREDLDLSELKGKTLVCWCAPKKCHGDVLAKMADAVE